MRESVPWPLCCDQKQVWPCVIVRNQVWFAALLPFWWSSVGLLDKHILAALDAACHTPFPIYWPPVFYLRLFANKQSAITTFLPWVPLLLPGIPKLDILNTVTWAILADSITRALLALQGSTPPNTLSSCLCSLVTSHTNPPYPSCGMQLSLVLLLHFCLL